MPPTYEYECAACKHRFEDFQSMSAKPLKKCPECGKRRLLRLLGTGAGIIFKGSGFYETDYKRKSSSYGKEEKADSGPKGESKSDAKPDPKTSAKPEPKPAAREKKSDAPKKTAKKDD